MIEPKELRIGNWIYDDAVYLSKIIGFHPLEHSVRCDEKEGCEILVDAYKSNGSVFKGMVAESKLCEPILLTKEWLLKFGFKSGGHDYMYFELDNWFYLGAHGYGLNNAKYEVILTASHNNELTIIKYVHRLQNLYFELTDKELKTLQL